jgi:hypothetical protein
MTEVEEIEKVGIESFLPQYNHRMGTDYRAVRFAKKGEAPDAICRDSTGNHIQIEVTLTEDNPMDLPAQLGRSEHKSLDAVQRRMDRVKLGLEPIWFSSLEGNVLEMAVSRITSKYDKRYGPRTLLLVRDTSPLNWDWSNVIDKLRSKVDLPSNPFDLGIWILNFDKSNIFEIVRGTA